MNILMNFNYIINKILLNEIKFIVKFPERWYYFIEIKNIFNFKLITPLILQLEYIYL